MASPNFIDEVKIYMRAGHGGAGSVHFRREKFIDKGGPDGGDGGHGGDIILKCNPQLSTLIHLKYQKHILAEDGKNGEGSCRSGAHGASRIIEVPQGTLVTAVDTQQTLVDITEADQVITLMAGGKGGKGNVHFKTPTQQTPRYAQPGIPGEEGTVQLELKLMAEVGLVGFPNAGKSTLLATLSAAKPKIANYPFTTLTPQLGVVPYRKDNAFVMADIPGLIEGAAQGRGLGIQFLKHIERNLCLLFLIAADTENIPETYDVLQQELQNYNPALLQKPSLIVISKSDMLTEEDKDAVCQGFSPALKPIFISALTNQGLEPLKDHIWHLLHHDG